MPPAYLFARLTILPGKDEADYRATLDAYRAGAHANVEAWGGTFVTLDTSNSIVLEGVNPLEDLIVVRFPSIETAREWYACAEYQEIRQLRDGFARTGITVIEAP